MPEEIKQNLKWYEKFSYSIIEYTEHFFYNLGFYVASNPWKTIAACWAIVCICALGFLNFHQEKDPLKLWIPPQSTFLSDTNWLMSKFQNGFRMESIIIEAPDVLTPSVLYQVAQIDEEIKASYTSSGIGWENVCFKIPEVDSDLNTLLSFGKNRSNVLDPSVIFNTATYCKLVNSFQKVCFDKNLLKLWDYNQMKLQKITKAHILNKLDANKIDPILGHLRNYEELLGGIKRNESGHIIGATTLRVFYAVYVNFSAIDMDKSGNIAGTADWASTELLEWENLFINVMNNISRHYQNINIYYSSARSFGDISESTIFQDFDSLAIGVVIMIIYVQFVISKFNCVEARILLANLGLLSVGMAFIVACGFCSLIGIYYGPVHTSLPFLLMGLGVDDMFVIMACWNELIPEANLSLERRVGYMLKHAGVSITVTTVTDITAFLVGSSSILPCLESFCLYAAAGVFMTFVFIVTFFTACFTLDQRRVEANRNGAIVCIKHKTYTKNECSQLNVTGTVFNMIYSKVIFTTPGKIAVLLLAAACLGFSAQACLKLEQKFDPSWFIPKDNYLANYLNKQAIYYPLSGFEAGLYLGSLNYTEEMPKILQMTQSLMGASQIAGNIQSWVEPFHSYVKRNFKKDLFKETLTTHEFNLFLSKFLFSPQGLMFQANFKFTNELECGIPVSNITMSSIDFRLNLFHGRKEYLPAMHEVIDIAKRQNYTTGDKFSTAWSIAFATWVTDEFIDVEVTRNLLLALLCVMMCTILLVANLQMCFWIFLCVLLTMVNVCGFMQCWGVTIDLVSCIGLELAIGLCVDYATHIGHTFLRICEGTTYERSLKTVVSIGSAVLYGGFSTFIGVSMLGFSKAYTFHIFFKIFCLVVLFGLFNGIVLLPVILTWIGPKPYYTHKPVAQSEAVIEETSVF